MVRTNSNSQILQKQKMDEIVNRLYGEGDKQQKKLEELKKKVEDEKNKELTHQPVINKKSEKYYKRIMEKRQKSIDKTFGTIDVETPKLMDQGTIKNVLANRDSVIPKENNGDIMNMRKMQTIDVENTQQSI